MDTSTCATLPTVKLFTSISSYSSLTWGVFNKPLIRYPIEIVGDNIFLLLLNKID